MLLDELLTSTTPLDRKRIGKAAFFEMLRLRDVDGLAVVHLDEADIVRNPIVQRIVSAYEDESPRQRRVRE